ncbi:MAG: HD domain-containing protein, partial [Candidatus Magasanikbacteria bacterium]|nr:HD domain-containing protein [Candidatus Magasanikbacteria bacterium]
MEIILPDEVYQVINKFTKAGYKVFLVGGAVRDLLMKKPHKDWDLTTDARPEQILEIFPDGFYENAFGTVGIKTGLGILEITTMRKEGKYEDFRRPSEVSWTKEIIEDLGRRDFTINAVAIELDSSHTNPIIIDPFKGQADLDNKLIKAVGDPDVRFREDALRLMRAIRLATQLGFKIEEETLQSIRKNHALINNISGVRVRDELFKILSDKKAFSGILLLKETGLLEIILPEVTACFGILQEGPKHDRVYDIGEHNFLALNFCPGTDPLVKLAALLHDIGKSKTYRKDETGNVTFFGHETVGASMSKKISERLRLSRKDADKLFRLIRWHMFTVSEHQTDSAVRRFIKNVGIENIDDMMAIRVADRLGGGTQTETSWRMEQFKQRIKEVMTKP